MCAPKGVRWGSCELHSGLGSEILHVFFSFVNIALTLFASVPYL